MAETELMNSMAGQESNPLIIEHVRVMQALKACVIALKEAQHQDSEAIEFYNQKKIAFFNQSWCASSASVGTALKILQQVLPED